MTYTLFPQVLAEVRNNPAFIAALERGTLDDAAIEAISNAFDAVIKRNDQLSAMFREDKKVRESITKFHFARALASVKAEDAYREAFKSGMSI